MNKLCRYVFGMSMPVWYLGAVANVAADIQISNISAANQYVAGQSTNIAFEVSSSEAVDQALIKVGLKKAAPELSLDENISLMDSNTPDLYLLNLHPKAIAAGEIVSIDTNFVVPENMDPASYALVVNVEPVTLPGPGTGSAVILGEETLDKTAYAYASSLVTVAQPDLPNLRIVSAGLAGDTGYYLDKNGKLESIRVNLEIASESLDVNVPVSTTFALDIPGRGRFALNVMSADGEGSDASWVLTPSCSGCSTLSAGNSRGGALSLELDQNMIARIAEIADGEMLSLAITVDPNGQIDEWQGNKADNTAQVPVYVFN